MKYCTCSECHEMKPIMTVQELADYLGKKPNTLTQWRYKARGPAWTTDSENSIGRKEYLYHADDVQAWLDSKRVGRDAA